MKIKDFFVGILVVCTLVVIMGLCGYIETHYSIKGTVTKEYRNGLENCVTITDIRGEEWEWVLNGNELSKGDKVLITLHTNYTDAKIEDDIVTKIKGLK